MGTLKLNVISTALVSTSVNYLILEAGSPHYYVRLLSDTDRKMVKIRRDAQSIRRISRVYEERIKDLPRLKRVDPALDDEPGH